MPLNQELEKSARPASVGSRPLGLTLVLVLAAVAWPVFLDSAWLFLLLSLLLPWMYYTYHRRRHPDGVPLRLLFIAFAAFSLLLSQLVFCRVQNRVREFRSLVASQRQSSRQPLVITGIIVGFPEGYYDSWLLPLRVEQVHGDHPGGMPFLRPGMRLSLRLPPAPYDSVRLPLVGDRVTVKAMVRGYQLPKHPFLAAGRYRWMAGDSLFFAEASAWSSLNIEPDRRTFSFLRAVDSWRRRLYREIHRQVHAGQVGGVLTALLLGTRDSLTPEMKDLFLDYGIYHLFAISGLHVGIVVSVVFFFTVWLLNWLVPHFFIAGPRKAAAAAALLAGWLYVPVTGMHLPAVRAGIMASIFLGAIMLDVAEDSFSALMLAVIIILAAWPQSLFQLSFQLSVAAVAAILVAIGGFRVMLSKLKNTLRIIGNRLPPWTTTLAYRGAVIMVVGTAAWLATMPLLINRFHYLTPFSLLSNLFLVPLFSFLVLPLGILALVLLPLPGLVGSCCLRLLAWLLTVIVDGCQWLHALIPRFRWYFPSFSGLELLLFYGFWLLLGAVLLSRKKLLPVAALLLVLAVGAGDWIYWQDRREHRNYLSISCFAGGSLQAAVMEMPNGDVVLLNGGAFPRHRFSMARQVIAPYCWSEKISRVKALILTSPQNGSVADLDYLVRSFKIREIWYNGLWTGYPPFRQFYEWTRKSGVRWRKLTDLSRPRYFDQLVLTTVNPLANGSHQTGSWKEFRRQMSLSLQILFGGSRVLLWGGTEVGLKDWLHRDAGAGKRLDALICVRPLTATALLFPGPDRRPQLLVSPRVAEVPKKEREVGCEYWQTREDGFLRLDLYPDGKIMVNSHR